MRTTAWAVGMFFLVTVAGCAENRQQQALADAEGGYTAPASIYSALFTKIHANKSLYINVLQLLTASV